MSSRTAKPPIDREASEHQFWHQVIPEELKYIKKRWTRVYDRRDGGANDLGSREAQPTGESAKNNLVGLAFSGGGIRSATFNLGLAQSLHEQGVLDHVDYLSTVSGGGYVGSSISTLMRDGAEFPFEHQKGPIESPYLTWLRNHSNYLAERGFLDYTRIAAVLLRGVLINFLVLVPFLLILSVVMALYYGGDPTPEVLNRGVLHRWGNWWDVYNLTRLSVGLTVVYILLFPVIVRVHKVLGEKKTQTEGSDSSVKERDLFERSFNFMLLVTVGLGLIESLPVLLHYFHLLREDHGVIRGIVASGAGGSAVVALTVVGKLLERFTGLLRTLVLWLVGLLGLVLPLLLVLYVAEALVWEWPGTTRGKWIFVNVFVGLIVGGLLASAAAKWIRPNRKRLRAAISVLVGVVGFGLPFLVLFGDVFLGRQPMIAGAAPEWFILALAAAIWLFCWLAVDINLTSIHGFYRDRLSAAYLVGAKKGHCTPARSLADIDVERDINLQEICNEDRSIAPHHIVNVAHNLQRSNDSSIRERNSDFFTFTKDFYGGARTGYCSTKDLEAVFPPMDLATAMAISAAAASPNMGGATVGSLVAIMTLFNIRLGYWVPNPWHVARWAEKRRKTPEQPLKSTLRHRFFWRIRPRAFIKEMFSVLNERSRWINLSDGGHIENLAIYELLRRRCRYIIAGDAEADPTLKFGSLAKLKRFARLDMGIEIEILLDDVRKDSTGLSHQHCAFGKITYPPLRGQGIPEQEGYLLYVKSSVTGDEDEVIREYRAAHHAFPHESTADQFFDEGQFEAYRALGHHATDGLFDGGERLRDFGKFQEWFTDLGSNLAPSMAAQNLFLDLQSELSDIQELLQEDKYSHSFYEFHPNIARPARLESAAEDAEEERRNLYLVGKQLRLLENVFVALNLNRPRNWHQPGNAGWRRLFEDWTAAWKRSKLLKEIYLSRIPFHSKSFRAFCEKALGLPEPPNATS